MRITARGLNRSTLGRQLLLRREPLGVVDAVRRLVALQAQQAASPVTSSGWKGLTARTCSTSPAPRVRPRPPRRRPG